MNKNYIKKVLEKEFEGKIEMKSFQKRKPSLVYSFDTENEELFLKIKRRLTLNNFDEIIKNEELRNRGKDEYNSLNFLYNFAKQKNLPINFIKPIKYINEINGIVTKRIEGKDFWRVLKNKNISLDYKDQIMEKIGEGLSMLHEKTKEGEGEIYLETKKTGNEKIDKKVKEIIEKSQGKKSPIATIMPGFDIRDVIFNKNNEIFFVDPGKIKKGITYGQIASFLVAIKIIYQGSLSLLFCETENYEKAFLKGYFKNKNYDKELLQALVLNKLISEYNSTAKKKIKRKKFLNIPLLKNIIKKYYIDKFYFKEIEKTINLKK